MARLAVADAVTFARIPLGLALVPVALAAPDARIALTALFGAGIATDIADGWIARRSGSASARGARLDSLADAVFTAGAAVAVVASSTLPDAAWLWWTVAAVTGARLGVIAVTWVRFRRVAIMHTHLNRATGVAVAVAAGLALATSSLPLWALAVAGAISLAACADELAIVLGSSSYDADRRSSRKKARGVTNRSDRIVQG